MAVPMSLERSAEIFSRSLNGLFENGARVAARLLGNRRSFNQWWGYDWPISDHAGV